MSVDPCKVIERWSIEITAKDAARLEEAVDLIPMGTKIPITFLPGETIEARVATARRVKELGYLPIPHISARRLKSREELESFLAGIQQEVGTDHAFVVAGDPREPMGPYPDALSLIRTGLLGQYGIKRVGISGYPEGHPEIGNEKIWLAKREKQEELLGRGHDFAVVTQFAFSAEPMLNWINQVRKAGVDATIRLGIPGPASAKRLLTFAARCGVGAATSVMQKYGISLTKLLTTTGPDRLLVELAKGLDPEKHGEVLLHFYPFGGIRATAEWIRDFKQRRGC